MLSMTAQPRREAQSLTSIHNGRLPFAQRQGVDRKVNGNVALSFLTKQRALANKLVWLDCAANLAGQDPTVFCLQLRKLRLARGFLFLLCRHNRSARQHVSPTDLKTHLETPQPSGQ